MIEDKWSNTPQEAKVKNTGEVVKGFTDGHGHFDVFVDVHTFIRYDLSEISTPNDMTEFEQEVYDIVKYVSEHHDSLIGGVESYAKRHAKVLLLIAIEQTKDEIKTALLKEFNP